MAEAWKEGEEELTEKWRRLVEEKKRRKWRLWRKNRSGEKNEEVWEWWMLVECAKNGMRGRLCRGGGCDVYATRSRSPCCFTNTDLATSTFHNQLQIWKRKEKKNKESRERIKEYLLGKVPENNTVMKFKLKLEKKIILYEFSQL